MSLQGLASGGFDTYDKMREEDDLRNPSFKGAFRFRLEEGKSARIVFLSDQPDYQGYEHMVKINGKWQNFICPGEGCPACAAATQASERAYLAAYFSLMRITAVPKVESPRYPGEDNSDRSWESDWEIIDNSIRRDGGKGALILNPVQLLVAKKTSMALLKRQHEKRGGLLGQVYEVTRVKGAQNTPAIGNEWEWEKTYSKEQILALNPKAEPVNYEETLRVLTIEEVRALYTGNSERSAGSSATVAAPPPNEGKPTRPAW